MNSDITKRIFRTRLRHGIVICLILAAGFLVQSCAVMSGNEKATARKVPELTWPPNPAKAQIKYIGQITGIKDFAVKRNIFGRIFKFLVGLRPSDTVFSKPVAVCVDYNKNICVADPGTKAVFIYDRDRSTFECYRRFGGKHLLSPVAVASTGTRGIFFVADSALGEVFAADLKGRLLFTLSEGLERPVGLAVFGDRLFVADSKLHQIFVFDLQGHPIGRFGGHGRGPGQFNYPTHVATDREGLIYVTDAMNFRIQIFDNSFRYMGIVGRQGDASGGFSRPKGVGVDWLGHIYVADALFDNIQVFDKQGHFLLNWGQAGSKEGEFWLPMGISISQENIIYVADSYNRRIQVFQYVGNE